MLNVPKFDLLQYTPASMMKNIKLCDQEKFVSKYMEKPVPKIIPSPFCASKHVIHNFTNWLVVLHEIYMNAVFLKMENLDDWMKWVSKNAKAPPHAHLFEYHSILKSRRQKIHLT